MLLFTVFHICQVVAERETEGRSAQEQSSRLQAELSRLRQELQDKASQEDTLRQQMADKEEKTRKAIVCAKQKIGQLMGESLSPTSLFFFFFNTSSSEVLNDTLAGFQGAKTSCRRRTRS